MPRGRVEMGYVVAAYLIVLGAMGIYWWSLFSRENRLKGEGSQKSASPERS